MNCTVRPYRHNDRSELRHVCCQTGFMGNPVDPLFSDRDVFADFFTRYYTDFEPEHAWVADDDGEVVGYLIGCLRYRRYPVVQAGLMAGVVFPKVLCRMRAYRRGDFRFLAWFLMRSGRETPCAPARAGHFHFNLLPPFQGRGVGRELISRFLDSARAEAIPRIYGRIQTFEKRRRDRVFERYGFRLFDKRRITKFRPWGKENVYVSTYCRECTA